MKKFFLQIKMFAIMIFGGAKKFDSFIKAHAQEGVDVVDTLRDFVKNPIVLQLADAFKFKFGSKLGEFLVKAGIMLDGVYEMIVKEAECLKITDPLKRVQCTVDAMRKMSDSEVDNFSRTLAANYLKKVSTGYTTDGAPIPTFVANNIIENEVLRRKVETMSRAKEADASQVEDDRNSPVFAE